MEVITSRRFKMVIYYKDLYYRYMSNIFQYDSTKITKKLNKLVEWDLIYLENNKISVDDVY